MDTFRLDGHKLFWHLDRVHAWQQGELIPPIYIEVSPVSYCNHNCIFCGKDFVRDGRFTLDTDQACQRLAEMGSLGVRSIMFAGEGEPLLHPGLPRMARAAKEAGIDISITTNGSLGNPRLWSELLPILTWLRFSVDAGCEETYGKVHGVAPKVFDQTLRSLEDALAVRARMGSEATIGVQFLVLPENLADVEQALGRFTDLGVDYLSLKPFSVNPRMLKPRDVEYRQEMMERLADLCERFQGNGRTQVVFRHESMAKYMVGRPGFSACHALPYWGYVCANGDFYTCPVFIGDERFRAGNIMAQNMRDVLFGPARRGSVAFASQELGVAEECRINCRMARVNEFLEHLAHKPQHLNFI